MREYGGAQNFVTKNKSAAQKFVDPKSKIYDNLIKKKLWGI